MATKKRATSTTTTKKNASSKRKAGSKGITGKARTALKVSKGRLVVAARKASMEQKPTTMQQHAAAVERVSKAKAAVKKGTRKGKAKRTTTLAPTSKAVKRIEELATKAKANRLVMQRQITFRCSGEKFELLSVAATAAGVSVATFCRDGSMAAYAAEAKRQRKAS